ncbi:MAG: DUF1566 domain-containing protein [Nitrospirae bacterium]|nr:DUF1566 domain-containing protein [Nitrospirota bacterium]MBF0593174.1 DUF1566 domain-containing protein [Nitrospirota bacterium]
MLLIFLKHSFGYYIWPVCTGSAPTPTPTPTPTPYQSAGTVNLPQTGQTTSYDSNNPQWDDGALRDGVAWPNPRFTVNSDSTVTDNLTGLVWTKDASTPTVGSCTGGQMTWQAALSYVVCLNTASYLGHSDWRLPNVNELESLVNDGHSSTTWLNGRGFTGVRTTYWSSTTYANSTSYAWYVYMSTGGVYSYGKSSTNYVWALRAGQSGSFGNSAIWSTGQTILYDSNNPKRDDGALKEGVAWPTPRFADNGNNTVTDNLTGLIWAKDASTPTVGSCTGGLIPWQAAITSDQPSICQYADLLLLVGHYRS